MSGTFDFYCLAMNLLSRIADNLQLSLEANSRYAESKFYFRSCLGPSRVSPISFSHCDATVSLASNMPTHIYTHTCEYPSLNC